MTQLVSARNGVSTLDLARIALCENALPECIRHDGVRESAMAFGGSTP